MLLFCIQKANLNLELCVQKITIWVLHQTGGSSIATIWWKCLIWCVHKFDLKGKVMQSFVRFQNLLLSLGSHLRKMLLKTLACLKDLIVHFRPPSIVPCQQWQSLRESLLNMTTKLWYELSSRLVLPSAAGHPEAPRSKHRLPFHVKTLLKCALPRLWSLSLSNYLSELPKDYERCPLVVGCWFP